MRHGTAVPLGMHCILEIQQGQDTRAAFESTTPTSTPTTPKNHANVHPGCDDVLLCTACTVSRCVPRMTESSQAAVVQCRDSTHYHPQAHSWVAEHEWRAYLKWKVTVTTLPLTVHMAAGTELLLAHLSSHTGPPVMLQLVICLYAELVLPCCAPCALRCCFHWPCCRGIWVRPMPKTKQPVMVATCAAACASGGMSTAEHAEQKCNPCKRFV